MRMSVARLISPGLGSAPALASFPRSITRFRTCRISWRSSSPVPAALDVVFGAVGRQKIRFLYASGHAEAAQRQERFPMLTPNFV